MPESYLARFGRQPAFPTEAHCIATEVVVDYFAADARVQAVLLTCSCARGMAVPASCVDMCILVAPEDLEAFWHAENERFEAFAAQNSAIQALVRQVPWAAVDLNYTAGAFAPRGHGWTSGADEYELEIGNTLAWVHPLLLRGTHFETLQAQYLPYYDEAQRVERLSMVKRYAANNLEHIVPYAIRGLYEQAFKRLYHAFEEYLQALFIQRRIYPIAYDKWLREQIVEVLQEPALYDELLAILALRAFSVRRLGDRARRLGALLEGLTS
jgi:hypothetical protein